jgi:hypothetical protein
MPVTNPATSSKNSMPVNLARPLMSTVDALAMRPSPKRPLPGSMACMNQRTAGESMASISRSGAVRKSSALLVGGVSKTIRSQLDCLRTAWSFSIAMYSCVPASEPATYW